MSDSDDKIRCLSTVNLSISNLELYIGLGTLLLTVLVYWASDSSIRDVLKFMVATITVLAAVFAAIFAGKAMAISRQNAKDTSNAQQAMYEETLANQKVRFAYDMVQSLGDASSVRVREVLKKDIEDDSVNDSADESQYYRIVKDAQLNMRLIHVLGIFEDIAIAVRREIVDEQFVKDSICPMVIRYYDGFEGYIKGLRRVS